MQFGQDAGFRESNLNSLSLLRINSDIRANKMVPRASIATHVEPKIDISAHRNLFNKSTEITVTNQSES